MRDQLNYAQIEADALAATPDQIADAVDFFHDCQFIGIDEIEFTPFLAVQGIQLYYCGGWEQFLADGQPL